MVLTPLQNAEKQYGRLDLGRSNKSALEDIYSGNGHNGKAVKSQIIFQVASPNPKKVGTPGPKKGEIKRRDVHHSQLNSLYSDVLPNEIIQMATQH